MRVMSKREKKKRLRRGDVRSLNERSTACFWRSGWRLWGETTRSRFFPGCVCPLSPSRCYTGTSRTDTSMCAAQASPKHTKPKEFRASSRNSSIKVQETKGLRLLLPTRKASLNSKEHGNCLWSWCTQSNHCRKTGHLSFKSSAFSPWPQRSANLWPKSNHSVSTSTWKPWKRTGEFLIIWYQQFSQWESHLEFWGQIPKNSTAIF